MQLRFEVPSTDAVLADWRHVHNVIVPPAALSLDEVRERAGRNCLEVAYLGDVLVGCTTVRPPAADASPATEVTGTEVTTSVPDAEATDAEGEPAAEGGRSGVGQEKE